MRKLNFVFFLKNEIITFFDNAIRATIIRSSGGFMEVYVQIVRDEEGVRKACEMLGRSRLLGFDTETTELDPYKGVIRLVQLSDGKSTQVIDLKPFFDTGDPRKMPELQPLRDLLSDPNIIKVAHNAKFDAKWVRHHLGAELFGAYDTYLASQLISAGDQDRRHSLHDVAQFFTGIELDKTQQVSDWGSTDLSNDQIEYAARDAAVMLPLRDQIAERLKVDGLEDVAALEFDCITPIAEMELNGFFIDEGRWRTQLEKTRGLQIKAADELQELLSAGVAQATLFGRPEINLDSQQQVMAALVNLGIPVPETTRGWQLQPLAEEYPVIQKLLEYRSVAKAISSFGENILEFIQPATGRLHADFRQIGAPTGRFSCSNPNLQQIPHDVAYRRCFRADRERSLIVADYSQIELRILAEFSEDKNFIEAFRSGADFHTTAASRMFGVKPENITSEQRSFAKRLNFGIVYGVGASRFALMTGLSQSEAENTMRKYFGTFTGLDAYLRNAGNDVIANRVARTASGRMLRLRFDENDRQQVSAARRYGVNMPIQGTSADILKRALRLLHEELRGTTGKLVNIVHDEIIIECDSAESETLRSKLENAMISAAEDYIKKVPIKVDAHISAEWAK
jgi:DNA polymerase I-like protein with 3'-5' exonuclease and polymerase domains